MTSGVRANRVILTRPDPPAAPCPRPEPHRCRAERDLSTEDSRLQSLLVEREDLRLLLGLADGVDVPTLAEDLGVSETTVRRRLRRMSGPGGTGGWLRHCEAGGYEVTDRGQDAMGPAKQAATALDRVAASLGIDKVSLAHVELVMAVVAAGSIGKAARRLGLPQSSVSAKVSRIEERWGTTLFVRNPTGVLHTAALAELLPLLTPLEKARARLRNRADGVPDAPTASSGLELAVELTFSVLLESLAEDGLDVRTHAIDIPHRKWTRAMCEADICVYLDLPMARLPVPPDHETAVAFADPVFAVLPAELAAGRSVVGLGELADQDWLTGAVGGRNHSSVAGLCRSVGFEPRVKFTANHNKSARQILETGSAVALTSASLRPGQPDLSAVRLAEDFEVRLTVGWRRGSAATGVAHRIVRWMRDAHVRHLAATHPELLAEMRADPDRWPHLVDV